MTDSKLRAKIVRVKMEEGRAGLFYATSPDLSGLLVAEPTIEQLEAAIPSAIMDLYRACGVKVLVTRAEDGEKGLVPWVAFPAELAARSLATA